VVFMLMVIAQLNEESFCFGEYDMPYTGISRIGCVDCININFVTC